MRKIPMRNIMDTLSVNTVASGKQSDTNNKLSDSENATAS